MGIKEKKQSFCGLSHWQLFAETGRLEEAWPCGEPWRGSDEGLGLLFESEMVEVHLHGGIWQATAWIWAEVLDLGEASTHSTIPGKQNLPTCPGSICSIRTEEGLDWNPESGPNPGGRRSR